MVRWVVGSISHGGPLSYVFVPASAPQLVLQRPWYVLSCQWDGAYKRTLVTICCEVTETSSVEVRCLGCKVQI